MDILLTLSRADARYVWRDDGEPCSGVVIGDGDGFGQCLVSTCTFQPGIVVLREEPSHLLSGKGPASVEKAVRAAVAGTHLASLAGMIANVLHACVELGSAARARLVLAFFHAPDAPELSVELMRVVKAVQRRLPAVAACDASELVQILLIWLLSSHSAADGSVAWRDGAALFAVAHRANHSCSPNVAYRLEGGRLVYRALRHIATGEAVCPSYLWAHELLQPTHLRRALLAQRKYFLCGCERCARPADPVRALPCTVCRTGHAECVSDGTWRCDACASTDAPTTMALEEEAALVRRVSGLGAPFASEESVPVGAPPAAATHSSRRSAEAMVAALRKRPGWHRHWVWAAALWHAGARRLVDGIGAADEALAGSALAPLEEYAAWANARLGTAAAAPMVASQLAQAFGALATLVDATGNAHVATRTARLCTLALPALEREYGAADDDCVRMRAFVHAHAGSEQLLPAPMDADSMGVGLGSPSVSPPALAASVVAAPVGPASVAAAASTAAASAAAVQSLDASVAHGLGASSPIRIGSDPSFGRHALAARALAAGECLLTEAPFGDCVADVFDGRVCQWCYGTLPEEPCTCTTCGQLHEEPRTCTTCGQLHACSAACWEALKPVHVAECDVLASIGDMSQTSGIASLRLYLRMLRRARTDPAAFAEVEAMAEHYDEATLERRTTLDEQAASIEAFARRNERLGGDRLARLIDRVHTSAFAMCDPSGTVRGTGLYVRAGSYFNHSCAPSAVVSFHGRRLRVHASVPIAEGDPITIACTSRALEGRGHINWHIGGSTGTAHHVPPPAPPPTPPPTPPPAPPPAPPSVRLLSQCEPSVRSASRVVWADTDLYAGRAARQEALLARKGFECQCRRCVAPHPADAHLDGWRCGVASCRGGVVAAEASVCTVCGVAHALASPARAAIAQRWRLEVDTLWTSLVGGSVAIGEAARDVLPAANRLLQACEARLAGDHWLVHKLRVIQSYCFEHWAMHLPNAPPGALVAVLEDCLSCMRRHLPRASPNLSYFVYRRAKALQQQAASPATPAKQRTALQRSAREAAFDAAESLALAYGDDHPLVAEWRAL